MFKAIIDKYYPSGSGADELRRTLEIHSTAVAALALDINSRLPEPLDPLLVQNAAMLHDIGIFKTYAPGINCHGTEPYLRHGIIGAQLLRECGAPEAIVNVAMRHTGAGITAADIIKYNLPLPPGDYTPRTSLEKLICYADKFFSKTHLSEPPKSLERVRTGISKWGEDSLLRFDSMHRLYMPYLPPSIK
ncbi:MAG: HDIG domain-containing protein [Muribaculaceae bacterium]|nr:HDIG domain-containing protein [Muribaculaceae bacterium]